MILTMNRKSLGKTGPVEYFLDSREKDGTAITIRGNPEVTKSLIKVIERKHKYLSGGLMFSVDEFISEKQEQEIIDAFEKMLFVGLDSTQYHILWVKHVDKGRIELNFLVPRIELSSGKDLDLYSHRRDLPLFDMWKNGINARYRLADPNDPRRERTVKERANTAREKNTSGTIVANRKTLDQTLHSLVREGSIRNRDHMIELLKTSGYEITRKNTDSMSVRHTDIGKRALRLKGGIYSENFRSIESIGGICQAREREIEEYDLRVARGETRPDRTTYHRYIQTRTERHQKRYPFHPEPTQGTGQSHSKKSQNTQKRDSNDLVAKINLENERRVDDRVRKSIEESSTERARSKKRARERTREAFDAIREHNEAVSRELASSYNQSLKHFAESERVMQEQIAAAEQEALAGLRANTKFIEEKVNALSISIERIGRWIEQVRKSIKGVLDKKIYYDLKKLAIKTSVSLKRPKINIKLKR